MKNKTAILATIIFGGFACGEEEPKEPSIDEEACALIAKTPTVITANADRAAAPALATGENVYQITLDTAMKTYVQVVAAEPGDFAMFLSLDNVASGKYFLGAAEKTLAGGEPNENCAAAIPDHYHLELEEAGTYAIELNPSAAKVNVVIHPDEDHAHE